MCSIPALILAIVALGTTGSAQKSNAGISIALNVVVVVCTVLSVVVIIPVYIVVFATAATSGTCTSYYASSYNTYCVPYSYTSYYCSYYYTSYSGYCPT